MTTCPGVWNGGLVPGALAATTLLALLTFVAAGRLVARMMTHPDSGSPDTR